MKKSTNYGEAYVTKGIAYVRHHISDRLMSAGIATSRNEANWLQDVAKERNQSFLHFLQENLDKEVFVALLKNRKQLVWSVALQTDISSSSLAVMDKELYSELFKVDFKTYLKILENLKTIPIASEQGRDIYIFV